MKRRGRADEALAALNAPAFRSRLGKAIQSRGNVPWTTAAIRELASPMLPPGTLDGVKATFRWDAGKRRLGIFVKGASTDLQAQEGTA